MVLSPKQDAISKVLYHWFRIKGKRWGIISQDWLLEMVEKAHGIKMSRRTLNRCLAKLRDMGIVYTEQRHRRDKETGEFCPEVSIYYFTDELKAYITKVFTFFRKIFGFSHLTEYTVSTFSKPKTSQNALNSEQQKNPPGRAPHWTKFENLGGSPA